MDKDLLVELIKNNECEWIEYKENWFDREQLGQYISAMSNAAAYRGEESAYFIWGIKDGTKEIVGTDFQYDVDVKNEPLKHYLARLLSPSIPFKFETFHLDGKRIVCLTIPAAKRIMTEFNKERFIRIGSSKELLRKYPEIEIDLAVILKNGMPTIVNTPSRNQLLNFTQLKSYYVAKGAPINEKSFEENLCLFVPGAKKYNELAFILSDENDITCRISVFSGKKKSDNQYSLDDFGKKCILITVDQILSHLESLNVTKLDERGRVVERKETPLFDSGCLREALLNAFIHNDWVDLNAPMISVFEDRIEILSYGGLPAKQTITGFFAGKSKPRCIELAEIFLQLRISERSGRGVNRIYDRYGESAFQISNDFVKVTIPFAFRMAFGSLASEQKKISKSERAKNLILREMRNNASITTLELMHISGLGKTSIQKYIKELADEKAVERIGNKKGGHWKVNG